jgi:hypothetical protein
MVKHIFSQHGFKGLQHGTSSEILKTFPKYYTAIYVKDHSSTYQRGKLLRSALESIMAGIA